MRRRRGQVANLSYFLGGDFAEEEPGSFAVVGVFGGAVEVEVEDAVVGGADAKVVSADPPGAALFGGGEVGGLHVFCHAAAPFVVVPFFEHFDDLEGLAVPDEAVGAAGFFLEEGRPVVFDLDGFADEADVFSYC